MTPETPTQSPSPAFLQQNLQKKLLAVSDAHEIQLGEALSLSHKARVFRASWKGRDIVVKQVLHNSAAWEIERAQREMDYLAENNKSGTLHVQHCVAAWPQAGLIVLSYLPGIPLSRAVQSASQDRRFWLFEQAGIWLKSYTDLRAREAVLGARYWYRKTVKACDKSEVAAEDRETVNLLLAALQRQLTGLENLPIRQSHGHGDFHGRNILVDGQTLGGIDIAFRPACAVARDVARFLTSMEIHHPATGTKEVLGLADEDVSRFLVPGLLLPHEVETSLKFFVGCCLVDEYLQSRRKGQNKPDALISRYLSMLS